MKNSVIASTCLALSFAWFASIAPTAAVAQQGYKVTILDDPRVGPGNYPYGGTDISQLYGNTYVGENFTGGTHGVVDSNGSWSSLYYPGAEFTYATGISGTTIVGIYITPSLTSHAYKYSNGVYTNIDVPGTSFDYANGIYSNSIVGIYQGGTLPGYLGISGFVMTGSNITNIDDSLGTRGTEPNAIYQNEIVGDYFDSAGNTHGFLDIAGNFTTIDDPLNIGYSTVAGVYGSTIVGNFGDGSGETQGFIYSNGKYKTFDIQGSTSTAIRGITGDTIVGSYYDTSGIEHGFSASPTPEPGNIMFVLSTMAGIGIAFKSHRKPAA